MTQAQDKALFNQNKRLIKSKMAQESVCPYCNSIMLKDTTSPYNLVSIDHITAYSKGGDDSLENLIPCCANCNTKKGNTPNATMFKLQNPRILSNYEYEQLNDYTTVSVRIDKLKSMKDLILSGELKTAIALSQESERTTISKSFFSKLSTALKNNTNPDYIIKEVIVRLKAEMDKMTNLTESTQHIKFTIYNLE
jgi:hypothetical protein